MSKTTQELQEAVIRFAGDSGDGMQLTGGRFTETTAVFGNDLSTLPDFPAEIRAPAGSLAGVSAFQIKFSSKDIHTPDDAPNVLVAMNPAALKVHQQDVAPGGTIIHIGLTQPTGDFNFKIKIQTFSTFFFLL